MYRKERKDIWLAIDGAAAKHAGITVSEVGHGVNATKVVGGKLDPCLVTSAWEQLENGKIDRLSLEALYANHT